MAVALAPPGSRVSAGAPPPALLRVTEARGPARAGRTLEDLLGAAWAGLLEEATVECPVCRGTMRPRLSAAAGVVGGRCGDCHSTLS